MKIEDALIVNFQKPGAQRVKRKDFTMGECTCPPRALYISHPQRQPMRWSKRETYAPIFEG